MGVVELEVVATEQAVAEFREAALCAVGGDPVREGAHAQGVGHLLARQCLPLVEHRQQGAQEDEPVVRVEGLVRVGDQVGREGKDPLVSQRGGGMVDTVRMEEAGRVADVNSVANAGRVVNVGRVINTGLVANAGLVVNVGLVANAGHPVSTGRMVTAGHLADIGCVVNAGRVLGADSVFSAGSTVDAGGIVGAGGESGAILAGDVVWVKSGEEESFLRFGTHGKVVAEGVCQPSLEDLLLPDAPQRLVGRAVPAVFPFAQIEEEILQDIFEIVHQPVVVHLEPTLQLQANPVVQEVVRGLVRLLVTLQEDVDEIRRGDAHVRAAFRFFLHWFYL